MRVIKDANEWSERIAFLHRCPTDFPVILLSSREAYYCSDGRHTKGFGDVMRAIVAYRLHKGNLPVIYEPAPYRYEQLPESLIASATAAEDRSSWPQWALTAIEHGWTMPKGWKP